MSTLHKRSKLLTLCLLILAGEAIFSLPFHIARFFRPTLLETFSLTNTELGDLFAVYGVVAMLAYFPGGWIADRYPDRILLSLALWLTALGGLYLGTIPDVNGLYLLFAYWGLTTILLFWAALIRSTRFWGGAAMQGRAFGLLEGGRGLVAAGLASIAVSLAAIFISSNQLLVTEGQRLSGIRTVIYFYTAVTAITGFLVWYLLPNLDKDTAPPRGKDIQTEPVNLRYISLQALIVVCAYCGYKGLDYYGWFAHEVLGLGELESARLTSIGAYLRPVAAVAAGIIVDRLGASKIITLLFTVLALTYFTLGYLTPENVALSIILANLLISAVAVLAIRGVYFALLEESRIPRSATGIAVGMVSLIGFTPDIFFASLAGRILDYWPATQGFHYFFLLLTGIAITGMLGCMSLFRTVRKNL